jgi:hypothetical protein
LCGNARIGISAQIAHLSKSLYLCVSLKALPGKDCSILKSNFIHVHFIEQIAGLTDTREGKKDENM